MVAPGARRGCGVLTRQLWLAPLPREMRITRKQAATTAPQRHEQDRADRSDVLLGLRGEFGLRQTYFALIAASCAIATFGLLENSAPVIIGAMLIAPLMTPIVALALALVSGELATLRESLAALVLGSAVAIAFSACIALAAQLPVPGSEILSRGQPNLLDLGIALAAGAIAGYARIRKGIATSVGGAAIAVALMPPLCVVGIGISLVNWELAYGALLLFATNLVGITLACALVFVGAGFATKSARGGILSTAVALTVVAIPLGFATTRLVEQQRLEAVLRSSLIEDTQTFKRVHLLSTNIDWVANPPRVELAVRSPYPVTPTQVAFLQTFVEQRIRRKIHLIVDVSTVLPVEASTGP